MGATSIEWTDFSINPLRAKIGVGSGHYCEKLSPGCKHCYSSRLQPRFRMPQFQEQRGAGVEHWLDRSKLVEVLKRRKPTKWFWCDMTDMFGDWVTVEHIALCFATMAATPWHTHQVLTKRAERMRDVISQLYADDGALLVSAAEELAAEISACHVGEDDFRFPLPNVWLGTSVEDQARAEERIPRLREAPAAVRFVSAEPLLGPLDLSRYMWPLHWSWDARFKTPEEAIAAGANATQRRQGLVSAHAAFVDWVIVGSESGQRARPMDEEWVRSLRDQCSAAGTRFFYKQKLEGKKKVGLPMLDGRQWNEFPEVRA